MSSKIIIFGATGGVGSTLARKLSAAGHTLHLAARDATKLTALGAELSATTSVMDALEPASIQHAVADAGSPLKGLVWAIGSINLKPLARLTEADFERDFRLNALGAAQAIMAAAPALKASTTTASIVLFSSVAVAQGFAAHASISMAKGAVEGLTRALAAELAPKVRVNAIAPSLTRTPLAAALTSNVQMANSIAALHALPRLGEAEDIANAAAFLLLDESAWITGQILPVDGGRSRVRTKG